MNDMRLSAFRQQVSQEENQRLRQRINRLRTALGERDQEITRLRQKIQTLQQKLDAKKE